MTAFYNENSPEAAAWLRELIKQGHIAPGIVDERSIEDVKPNELAGFTQCHFFAGIGVWSHALRRAGWPDDRPVWTGSCPCQPFSAAGKGHGFDDERHLWPAFHHLISKRRPDTVLGEQVAGKDGLGWLDLVSSDMEGAGYAIGAVDTCAAGFGAPHIRQRLYWVADAKIDGRPEGQPFSAGRLERVPTRGPDGRTACSAIGGVADANDTRSQGHGRVVGLDAAQGREDAPRLNSTPSQSLRTSPTNGFWRDADWIFCRDGKWRAVESGTFPLAHGPAARVGRLRAYGNAIVPQVAEAFIRSFCELRGAK